MSKTSSVVTSRRTGRVDPWGLGVAVLVITAWTAHLVYLLSASSPKLSSPWAWVHVFVQAYLFTGLFITGHDAMHGTVTRLRRVNLFVGYAACFLFAGMSYRRLVRNHHAHHLAPTGHSDPDFHGRAPGFWPWWFRFMWHYATVGQIAVMGVSYNLLAHVAHVPEWKLLAYWIGPALLATLQLFYFGTYRPHRGPSSDDMAPHHARSLAPNHAWAMLSCYFFGYHWEHHASPSTPWWALWRARTGARVVRTPDRAAADSMPPRSSAPSGGLGG